MKKPLISVIMPNYNGEKYLSESIESILNQTFRDFEFIIIDDGSKDNSKKIIKKYQKKDKRIVLIENEKNLGLPLSLNKGLKKAKGVYIARMDSDDISLPKRLKNEFEYLEKHSNIFLIGSSAIIIDESGNRLGILKKFNSPKKIKKKFLRSNPIIHPSIMFRNFGKYFYRERFKSSEDYDFYLRILSSDLQITNLPEILIKYRISKNSFVSTKPNQKFYFDQSREFYLQRLKDEKDCYIYLKEPKKDIYPKEYEKNLLKSLIFIQLSDGQGKKVRENIKRLFKKYGFDKILGIYYLLSFFPQSVFFLIKRLI